MTINEEMLAALDAMDDSSKLFLLRTAKNLVADCPAVPTKKLRLASSDLGGRTFLRPLRRRKDVHLAIVRGPSEEIK